MILARIIDTIIKIIPANLKAKNKATAIPIEISLEYGPINSQALINALS